MRARYRLVRPGVDCIIEVKNGTIVSVGDPEVYKTLYRCRLSDAVAWTKAFGGEVWRLGAKKGD